MTGVLPENPAGEVYAPYIYIVPTGNTAATMRQAVPKMAGLALKLARGERLGTPEEDNYLPRGRRRNVFVERPAAERAVDMLLHSIRGEGFETELVIPSYDHVQPAEPVANLATAKLAVGTEGGTVPVGNPDHIEAVRATKWAPYPITGMKELAAGNYESAHGGYDARFANSDPNRMVPVDAMRAHESKAMFSQLHDHFFSTVGCGMPNSQAAEIGRAMAEEMKENGIEGIVLTAT
jgi:glycine reductase